MVDRKLFFCLRYDQVLLDDVRDILFFLWFYRYLDYLLKYSRVVFVFKQTENKMYFIWEFFYVYICKEEVLLKRLQSFIYLVGYIFQIFFDR